MAYHAGSVAGDSEIMVIIRSRGPQAPGTMAYYCADERSRLRSHHDEVPLQWRADRPSGRHHPVSRSSGEALAQGSLEAFRASLLARPEDSVLVVGHATFFRHFSGGRIFANCELAAVRK